MEEQNLFIGDVKILVVDEADTLFDEGFGPEVEKLMSPILARGGQVVLVTATLSKARKYLSSVQTRFGKAGHLRCLGPLARSAASE